MLWTTIAASALLLLLPAQCKHLDMFHISDLHLDSTYQAGGPVDHWCHVVDDPEKYNGTQYNDLSPAGDYKCDAPAVLVESAIRYLRKIHLILVNAYFTSDPTVL